MGKFIRFIRQPVHHWILSYRAQPPPPVYAYPVYQAPPPMPVPVNRYNSPMPFVSQNDVTRALNQDRFENTWEGPDYLAQKKLR